MNKIRSILNNTYYGQMSFLQKTRASMSYEEQREIMYRDYVSNIVETGFLTNPREAKLLNTKEYQKKCAKAICDGILKFLKTVEKNNGSMV